MEPRVGQRTISQADLLEFVISTTTAWARARQYGELRIVVQDGQIEFVHEATSHRGTLPKRSGPGTERARQLANDG